MTVAALVYPHQLFTSNAAVSAAQRVYLLEDPLFFSQYNFHRKKLILHRASMRAYAARLRREGHEVSYVESHELPQTHTIAKRLKADGVTQAIVVDPSDDWLSGRLTLAMAEAGVMLRQLPDTVFLTSAELLTNFAAGKERYFFADFYARQRRELRILVDADGKPIGGKWSFDAENRRKLPRSVTPPALPDLPEDEFVKEARSYVRRTFPLAPGEDTPFCLPVTTEGARVFLDDFVRHRLQSFGEYEDALTVRSETVFHSFLSSSLNNGLLTPKEVLERVVAAPQVPMNSREGFIRQIIGWREYVRLIYLRIGRRQRTANFFSYTRRMPKVFYDGTSGIVPLDDVIRRVLRNGWCHHIERLMVLGNFMLLCRIDPDEVYRWFMELFVDAYDWVMVPNVYGMSQHADGGVMMTKPYISGSNYLRKMSDYPPGSWCEIWDALFWSFVHDNRDYLGENQRMSMMTQMAKRLGPKLAEHQRVAEAFLEKLDAGESLEK